MSKISVIMGVYNCKNKELLFESVNSIINQTYKDWEFIICNDGSTDHTLELLREVEKLDSRIKIITYEKNRGLCQALNECLAHATGEYIARQDDDDISETTRFEKQIEFLENNADYDLVGTKAVVFDDQGVWGHYAVPEDPQKKDFLWNSPFIHPSTIMRASSLKQVHGYRFAKETRRCEDYDLFMRMYANGMKGYNLQEELYRYRIINDPKKTYRPMKYRLDEAKVRAIGYRNMGILLKGIPYICKPVIIGLIPAGLFAKIRKKQY